MLRKDLGGLLSAVVEVPLWACMVEIRSAKVNEAWHLRLACLPAFRVPSHLMA